MEDEDNINGLPLARKKSKRNPNFATSNKLQ